MLSILGPHGANAESKFSLDVGLRAAFAKADSNENFVGSGMDARLAAEYRLQSFIGIGLESRFNFEQQDFYQGELLAVLAVYPTPHLRTHVAGGVRAGNIARSSSRRSLTRLEAGIGYIVPLNEELSWIFGFSYDLDLSGDGSASSLYFEPVHVRWAL